MHRSNTAGATQKRRLARATGRAGTQRGFIEHLKVGIALTIPTTLAGIARLALTV